MSRPSAPFVIRFIATGFRVIIFRSELEAVQFQLSSLAINSRGQRRFKSLSLTLRHGETLRRAFMWYDENENEKDKISVIHFIHAYNTSSDRLLHVKQTAFRLGYMIELYTFTNFKPL